MKIEPVSNATIQAVASLESAIEGDHAASLATLIERQRLFPEGFLVATDQGSVIGYVESCLWDRNVFYSEDIDFSKHHDAGAKALYVIFLATDPLYRKMGIGSELIRSLQRLAKHRSKEKIILVARDELCRFYQKLGFMMIKPLPNFLPYASCTHMEWTADLMD